MRQSLDDGILPAMFTNEKLLGIVLVVFVIVASGYFAFMKFKTEVINVSTSPSPSPSNLDFLFNKTPVPNSLQTQNTNQSQQTELPLEKNKKLAQFPGTLKPEDLQNKKVIIRTAKGNVELEIYPDSPLAASNFVILAANGFYNGLTFHRVEKDPPVVQGGDPLGNGMGGPGYTFPDESVTRDYKKGIVAMANAGSNTNGSQFFIMTADYPFPPNYTIFGQVIAGMDVVEKIAVGDIMQKVTIQNLQ